MTVRLPVVRILIELLRCGFRSEILPMAQPHLSFDTRYKSSAVGMSANKTTNRALQGKLGEVLGAGNPSSVRHAPRARYLEGSVT
jgi:hypothetical protein